MISLVLPSNAAKYLQRSEDGNKLKKMEKSKVPGCKAKGCDNSMVLKQNRELEEASGVGGQVKASCSEGTSPL
jgi:hypothetical protein